MQGAARSVYRRMPLCFHVASMHGSLSSSRGLWLSLPTVFIQIGSIEMIITFSQTAIAALTCLKGQRRTEYCSKELPGLLLECRSSGSASWLLRYRAGTTKYANLGPLSQVTYHQACALAKDMKAKIRANGFDPRAEINARKAVLTFDEFFHLHYLPHAKVHKRSWKRDEQLYRIRIKAVLGTKRLSEVTRFMISSFHINLRAEGILSPASCDLHLRFLKHAFNLAIDWGLLATQNPALRIPLFNVENFVNNIPDEQGLARLFEVLRTDENRTVCQIVLLLIATGMRVQELLTSRYSNLNLPARELRVDAIHSKNSKQRIVALSDSAVEIINQLDTKDKCDLLLINKATGKGYTTVAKVFNRLRNKAGLPNFRCHDTRHLHASIMLRAGVGISLVMEALGHSNPTITAKRYCHIDSKTRQLALSHVTAAMQGAMQEVVKEAA